MSSNADLPLLMVVNHTRGEKVMMSPWDDMVSLDALFGIGTIMKWEVGKDKDNITFGTREAFDDCDYALYDKQGKLVYMPVQDDDEAEWTTDHETEDSDDSDDDESSTGDVVEEMKKLKVGQKRNSDDAEIDYEYEEVDLHTEADAEAAN